MRSEGCASSTAAGPPFPPFFSPERLSTCSETFVWCLFKLEFYASGIPAFGKWPWLARPRLLKFRAAPPDLDVGSLPATVSLPNMPLPNIVITGTPGTGKTTFSQLLIETLPAGFRHVNIGDVVKREKAHSGWNNEWDCWDVDEDKVRPSFPL